MEPPGHARLHTCIGALAGAGEGVGNPGLKF